MRPLCTLFMLVKKISALLLSLFFCISANGQYVDSVEQFLDESNKLVVKKGSASYVRRAYKSREGQWESFTYYAVINTLAEHGYYLDDSFKIKDGQFQTFYANGKPDADVSYYKNNKVGLWRIYSRNGRLMDSSRYKSTGMPFHKGYSWDEDGKLVRYAEFDMNGSGAGYETFYNEDGTVILRGKYVAGFLKDSIWSYHHINGNLSLVETYDSGKLIAFECFDTAGNKQVGKCDTGEVMPEAPYEVYTFLGKNSRMPHAALEGGLRGTYRVMTIFVVDTDGTIKDVAILKGSYGFFNDEALRIVRMLPKWKPARQHNRNVKAYYTLPITFKIE